MERRCHYEVLGLDRACTTDEIKSVRGLAEFAKKRVMDMVVKREEERKRKEVEEKERKKKAEMDKLAMAMAYEEPEWAKVEEVDADMFEEEERRTELYCVLCGKKFKSEKQWKNHDQSKKHMEKVAEFRKSIVDEEEEVEQLSEHIKEDLVIGGEDEFHEQSKQHEDKAAEYRESFTKKEEERRTYEWYCTLCEKAFSSEKLYHNHVQSKEHKDKVAECLESLGEKKEERARRTYEWFCELVNHVQSKEHSEKVFDFRESMVDEEEEQVEERRYKLYRALCEKTFKSDKQWKNHDQSKKHEDEAAEYGESFAARKKHNDKADQYRELFADEEKEQVDGLGDRMKEVLEIESDGNDEFNDFSDEEVVVNDDGGDDEEEKEGDDELELLKKMATRHKGRENVGEAVDNGESEEACENNNPDMEELISDSKVENVSTDKQDKVPAKRKRSSKPTVEKKKDNVKKEAHGKSKISSKGKKSKATSKNSSNASCGKEFGSRNM